MSSKNDKREKERNKERNKERKEKRNKEREKEREKRQHDEEDYLKEDPYIPGQEYALISMVEPKNSKLLMNRESFFMTHFIKEYIGDNSVDYEDMKQKYYDYIALNQSRLDKRFNDEHNKSGEITISGLKIRGVYPCIPKEKDIKKLHEHEPAVDIYVAPIGKWIPYCPINSDEILDVKYAHDKLNNVMKQCNKESSIEKQLFDKRVEERISSHGGPSSHGAPLSHGLSLSSLPSPSLQSSSNIIHANQLDSKYDGKDSDEDFKDDNKYDDYDNDQ